VEATLAVIFINYRREDTSGHAASLYKHLSDDHFGSGNIFYDRSSIQNGSDWDRRIREELERCEVLLALIGRSWLTNRLHTYDDYVRLEIITALKRDIRVIPVLVDGAVLPNATDLPKEMMELVRRQAVELDNRSDSSYKHDISRLAATIVQHVSKVGYLRIQRAEQWLASFGAIEIWIDDHKQGTIGGGLFGIGGGQVEDYDLSIGKHTLYTRCTSLKHYPR
jgi:hypothetical protein